MVKCNFLDSIGYVLQEKYLGIRPHEAPVCWAKGFSLLISRRRYSDTKDGRELGSYPNRSVPSPDPGPSSGERGRFPTP